jgi:hypothetical protein
VLGPEPSTCATRTSSSSDLARELARAALGELGRLREEVTHAVAGAPGSCAPRPRARRLASSVRRGDLLDQVLLGREVVVEGLLGDVGGVGDLERGGAGEALALEQAIAASMIRVCSSARRRSRRLGAGSGTPTSSESPVPWRWRRHGT